MAPAANVLHAPVCCGGEGCGCAYQALPPEETEGQLLGDRGDSYYDTTFTRTVIL